MRSVLLAMTLALAVTFAGCNRQSRDVNDFFPLGVGHDWVYDVVNGEATEKTRLEFHILDEAIGDRGEKRFFLDERKSRYYLRHGDVIGYSITPEIWTIFLSGPLRQGSKFDGGLAIDMLAPPAAADAVPLEMYPVKSSGYKLVTALNRKVTVPAGTFEDCLEVTHVAGFTTGVKYFAPSVGMVFAEAYFDDPRTKRRNLITRQELSYYRVGGKEGGTRPAPLAVDTPVPTPLVTTTSTPLLIP